MQRADLLTVLGAGRNACLVGEALTPSIFRLQTFLGDERLPPFPEYVLKVAVWCPAVAIPPRVPVCGHLPRGQRRELLWTIGRDNLVFEARVEVNMWNSRIRSCNGFFHGVDKRQRYARVYACSLHRAICMGIIARV